MSIQACSPLALPTLDMYLLLSKFESIHGVSIDATLQTNLYYNTLVVTAPGRGPPPGVLSMIMIITLKLVYTVASVDTRCIDSNLESGRYISRVGRARGFLSRCGRYLLSELLGWY